MLKYSAKEYFFRASLCHLCVDSLNAQHAIKRYEEQYPAFADSREAKLIKVRRRSFYLPNTLGKSTYYVHASNLSARV